MNEKGVHCMQKIINLDGSCNIYASGTRDATIIDFVGTIIV